MPRWTDRWLVGLGVGGGVTTPGHPRPRLRGSGLGQAATHRIPCQALHMRAGGHGLRGSWPSQHPLPNSGPVPPVRGLWPGQHRAFFFCGGKKRGFRCWRRRQVPAPRVTVSASELKKKKKREGGVLSVSGGGLSLEATLTHLNGDSRVVVGDGEGRPTPSRVHP